MNANDDKHKSAHGVVWDTPPSPSSGFFGELPRLPLANTFTQQLDGAGIYAEGEVVDTMGTSREALAHGRALPTGIRALP